MSKFDNKIFEELIKFSDGENIRIKIGELYLMFNLHDYVMFLKNGIKEIVLEFPKINKNNIKVG